MFPKNRKRFEINILRHFSYQTNFLIECYLRLPKITFPNVYSFRLTYHCKYLMYFLLYRISFHHEWSIHSEIKHTKEKFKSFFLRANGGNIPVFAIKTVTFLLCRIGKLEHDLENFVDDVEMIHLNFIFFRCSLCNVT